MKPLLHTYAHTDDGKAHLHIAGRTAAICGREPDDGIHRRRHFGLSFPLCADCYRHGENMLRRLEARLRMEDKRHERGAA